MDQAAFQTLSGCGRAFRELAGRVGSGGLPGPICDLSALYHGCASALQTRRTDRRDLRRIQDGWLELMAHASARRSDENAGPDGFDGPDGLAPVCGGGQIANPQDLGQTLRVCRTNPQARLLERRVLLIEGRRRRDGQRELDRPTKLFGADRDPDRAHRG